MKGYFINEDDGTVLYYGKRSQRPDLETGHLFIPSSNPKPDAFDRTYAWDVAITDTSDPSGWIQPQRLLDEKAKQINRKSLEATDKGMNRVLEDVIELLVSNGTILLTDLPVEARDKLASRANLRNRI